MSRQQIDFARLIRTEEFLRIIIIETTCVAPSFAATVSLNHENRVPLAAVRPKCNSILHLFGEWLFEAANIGTDAWIQNSKSEENLCHASSLAGV